MAQNIKDRKFRAFQLSLYQQVSNNTINNFWRGNIFQDLITEIGNMDVGEKLYKKKDTWVMRLDKFHGDNGVLYGAFYSARIGDRFDLFDTASLKSRENPKLISEGEDIPTHFIIRLSDGLFIIEDRSYLSGVTHIRIKDYFEVNGADTLRKHNIEGIGVETLLSKDFFKEIEKLDKRGLVEIKVAAGPPDRGDSEVVRSLMESAQLTNTREIKYQLSPGNGKVGYLTNELVEFLNPIVKSGNVLSVKVNGRRDGNKTMLKLSGCEEIHVRKVTVNEYGLTSSTEIYSVLKEIVSSRGRIG